MKRVIQAIVIVAFILAAGFFIYFLAMTRREKEAAALPVAGRIVDVAGSAAGKADSPGEGSSVSQRAKITPEWDETFLEAIDLNLDDDEDLEQVIAVKPSSAETGRLSIVVADYQASVGAYVRAWKGEILATKPNAVVVQARDLLGGGSVDLLCYGLDEANRQTLTVFRRMPGNSLAFRNVFSYAGASISVEDSGSSPAKIDVYEASPGGKSPLDQKKIVYEWNPARRNFERRAEFYVPGAKVEELFIGKVITGKAEDFESYLRGLWVKDDSQEPQPTSLYFDPAGRKIAIFSADEQQQWDWGGSGASFAGIYAPVSNGAVPEMLRILGVELVGFDRIRVQATSQQIVKFALKEDWNGIYKRSAGEGAVPQASSFSKARDGQLFAVGLDGSPRKLPLVASDFDGYYASEEGLRLELSGGKFELRLPDGVSKGNFYLFAAGEDAVLDLEIVDDKSPQSGRRSYIVSVRTDKHRHVGTLVLTPARVLPDRAEPLYRPDLVLSKIEDY